MGGGVLVATNVLLVGVITGIEVRVISGAAVLISIMEETVLVTVMVVVVVILIGLMVAPSSVGVLVTLLMVRKVT